MSNFIQTRTAHRLTLTNTGYGSQMTALRDAATGFGRLDAWTFDLLDNHATRLPEHIELRSLRYVTISKSDRQNDRCRFQNVAHLHVAELTESQKR